MQEKTGTGPGLGDEGRSEVQTNGSVYLLGCLFLNCIHTSASLISSLSSMLSTVRHPWLMLSYIAGSSLTRSFSAQNRLTLSERDSRFYTFLESPDSTSHFGISVVAPGCYMRKKLETQVTCSYCFAFLDLKAFDDKNLVNLEKKFVALVHSKAKWHFQKMALETIFLQNDEI